MKMARHNALMLVSQHIAKYTIALILIGVMSIPLCANAIAIDLSMKNISLKSHLIDLDKFVADVVDCSASILFIAIVVIMVAIFLIILAAMQRRYRALYLRSRKIAIKAKNLQSEANLFNVSLNSFNAFTWMYDYRTSKIYYDSLDSFLIDAAKIDTFQKVGSFLHPEDVESFQNVIRSVLDGKVNSFNYEYRSDFIVAGKYQWWEVRGVREVRYDEAGESYNAVCGVIININAHKANESQLTIAAQKATESERFKVEFLTALGHEFTIPLNVVLGFTQAIVDADNINDRKRYGDIIKYNGEVLENLIADIMDVSKIETGKIGFAHSYFDFAKVFNDIFLSLDKTLHKEVELKIVSPYAACYVEYDQRRLTQVLNNLVSNATNNTKHGSVTMSYTCVDNGIKIEVTDTGAGLSKNEIENAFALGENGIGLGLYICKTIVEHANGQVGVDSKMGVGSTFWAWLPCNAQVPQEAHKATTVDTEKGDTLVSYIHNNQNQPLNILVADDVSENYMILKFWLNGHNLDHAINGAEALRMASIKQYDIILMDLRMPLINGIEATSKIRKFDLTIPIIAVSAHAYDIDRQLALEAGCNDFISKPISKDALIECIKAHVK